ncbi:hypothetical protein EKO27_g5849 [Xylaria grammica]|uniref:Uncharacterized protein n=1 Tax=Xylaria grammica TaxID=363999 RepID=A0A439D4E4_9PEZI|nr:hypothetical protein EKO27_g5849 [Xylaria grammica]
MQKPLFRINLESGTWLAVGKGRTCGTVNIQPPSTTLLREINTDAAPLDHVVRRQFSNRGSGSSDLSRTALLSAAWALVASRRVNLDRVLFGVAAPLRPLQPVTTASIDNTLRALARGAPKNMSHSEDLSTWQPLLFYMLLHIQSLKHVDAPLSSGQEQNQEDDGDAWVDQLPRSFPLFIGLRIWDQETTAVARFTSNVFPAWMVWTSLERLGFVALQLAAVELTVIGVCKVMVVPVGFEKSTWVIVAVLAALKAGGAFLLLDPNLAPKRIQ